VIGMSEHLHSLCKAKICDCFSKETKCVYFTVICISSILNMCDMHLKLVVSCSHMYLDTVSIREK
jgi:hypothetical protein